MHAPPCGIRCSARAHHADERIDRYVHGGHEALARAVDDPPVQIGARTEGDGVQWKADIEAAPLLPDGIEQPAELRVLADVQWQQQFGSELFGERPHIRFCSLVPIGYREFRAEFAERLGAAIRDRLFIRDADDQRFLTGERQHANNLRTPCVQRTS
jgi:hypothetical protein